jgi:hypothetical protein
MHITVRVIVLLASVALAAASTHRNNEPPKGPQRVICENIPEDWHDRDDDRDDDDDTDYDDAPEYDDAPARAPEPEPEPAPIPDAGERSNERPRQFTAAATFGVSRLTDNDDLAPDRYAGYALGVDVSFSFKPWPWLHSETGLAFHGSRTTPRETAPPELAMVETIDFDTVGFWSGFRAQSRDGDFRPFGTVGTMLASTRVSGDGRDLGDDRSRGLGARVGFDADLTDHLSLMMSYGVTWMTTIDIAGMRGVDVGASTFLLGVRASSRRNP